MTIVAEINSVMQKFNSYEELFKELSKENLFISELTETEITCTDKIGKKTTIPYGEIINEDLRSKFIDSITEEKKIVKQSMDVMVDQGIVFTTEQKDDLNKKFQILKKNTN